MVFTSQQFTKELPFCGCLTVLSQTVMLPLVLFLLISSLDFLTLCITNLFNKNMTINYSCLPNKDCVSRSGCILAPRLQLEVLIYVSKSPMIIPVSKI